MSEYAILNKVDDPEDLKKLSFPELIKLSAEVHHLIRTTVEDVGGHYASPLGVVDLTIALHTVFNSPVDKLIWDVGHQAYAHKILTGRRDRFCTLRQKNGISGYLRRAENVHDVFGAGHASTAISAAVGFAHARDLRGSQEKVVAVVGDGAMTGGLSYEGLNNLGYQKTQMTIVLNDNKMSISPSVGALSRYLTKVLTHPAYNRFREDLWNATGRIPRLPSRMIRRVLRKTQEGIKGFFTPGALFEELGLRYIGPVDGHNLDELIRTFRAVKKMPNPTLVHVYTQKGHSSSLAEKDSVKYYSMSGNHLKSNPSKALNYSKVFGKCVTELAGQDDRITCITAAMAIGTGMSEYVEHYQNRYIDVGIAEGHAVTYAAGLAAEGQRPVVALYSTFLQRAWDNVFHDVLLQKLPVIFCMDRAGLVGPDGPTHHGVYDIALLRMLPGMVVAAPKDGNELRNLLATALAGETGFSIRYPKGTSETFTPDLPPEILPVGKWEVLVQGEKTVVLAVGSMVKPALEFAELCGQELQYTPTVINARFIKPLDEKLLREAMETHQLVITIEEGCLTGGFGSAVLEFAQALSPKTRVVRMGIPDQFIEHATREEQLEELGLTAPGLLGQVQSQEGD